MIIIKKNLPDNIKQAILETADKKCQCTLHECPIGVNKSSCFVTNSESDVWSEENIRVFCSGCIAKKHHLHLILPIIRSSDIKKLFKSRE
jgi:hypothetical protein